MKIENYTGLGKKVVLTVTTSEAIALLATLSDQLFQNKVPSGRTEMTMENGKYFDIRIDFNKKDKL